MALGFGYNAWLGVGAEGTYGTPATRAKFFEINSEALAAEDDAVYSASTYNLSQDVDNVKQGRKKVGGSFSFDLRRTGAELLFKHAMGQVGTTAMGTGGVAFQHAFSIPDAMPTGLTIEVNRDAAAFLYHGVKINEFTINGGNEGIVTVDMTVLAEDEGTVAASTPSFSTSEYWMFQNAALTYAGTARNVIDWKVTVNQNLSDDRYFWGSRYMNEPKRAGRIDVSGEMTVEFDGITDWTQFQSFGTGAMAITYTGATLDGTVTEQLAVSMPKVRLKGGVPAISDSGKITVTIPFEAYGDGVARPLTVTMINSTTGTAY